MDYNWESSQKQTLEEFLRKPIDKGGQGKAQNLKETEA